MLADGKPNDKYLLKVKGSQQRDILISSTATSLFILTCLQKAQKSTYLSQFGKDLPFHPRNLPDAI